MEIIAHRGFWIDPSEKNSTVAFMRALEHGFGIETDLRNTNEQIVISHDLPANDAITLDEFLEMCKPFGNNIPLALNIKADGLQKPVEAAIEKYNLTKAFAFDMSVPDTLGYAALQIPFYTRCSEYEVTPVFLGEATGVWLDAFHSEWYDMAKIQVLFEAVENVCVVSPELHGRPWENLWNKIQDTGISSHPGFSLCTDYPLQAKEFFK